MTEVEKPLLTITPANAGQYSQWLSPGEQAMLKRYPATYRINVYPSHRSARLPDEINAETRRNAEQSKLADGGKGLTVAERLSVIGDVSALVGNGALPYGKALELVPALAKRSLEGRRTRRIADETIADMQQAGLFRVLQPKRWGGYEMDLNTFYDVELALAEGDMSTAWIYGVSGVHPWFMALLDDRSAQDVWGRDTSSSHRNALAWAIFCAGSGKCRV